MDTLYNVNGLQFWDSREIRLRKRFEEHFAEEIEQNLLKLNSAWKFFQCETPILTPRSVLNSNYTNEDIWAQEQINEFEALDFALELRESIWSFGQPTEKVQFRSVRELWRG